MTEWNLKIVKADNGYVCTYQEDDEDSTIEKILVFEEDEHDELAGLEAMKKLLLFVSEHFGVIRNKHDKHYLNIELVEVTE